jgi:ABC-type glycerol-3-phosphate transport system permease component
MKRIDSQTRLKMVQAFIILFVMLAFPIFRLVFADRSEIPFALCVLIMLPSLFSLLPLVVMKGQQRRNKKSFERAQWLEEYRMSPESHLLHLND